jgi:hypothetical protein
MKDHSILFGGSVKESDNKMYMWIAKYSDTYVLLKDVKPYFAIGQINDIISNEDFVIIAG